MNLTEVVEYVYEADDDDLDAVVAAVQGARRERRARQRVIATATFKIGDAVQLTGLSPKYVNGTKGRITARTGAKFTVQFADPVPPRVLQRFGRSVRVSAVGLRKVA